LASLSQALKPGGYIHAVRAECRNSLQPAAWLWAILTDCCRYGGAGTRFGPVAGYTPWHGPSRNEEIAMKVLDILRVKGNTLYTVQPEEPLAKAAQIMAEKDIGSLVVMERGELVGMLTFREVILCIVKHGGETGNTVVRTAMDDHPLTCTAETELDEVRRMMLERHARYMPVMNQKMLMGVISFYDVAKAVVDSQNFENKMLKAYIRDWPGEDEVES
jgi:CBS domain-containing protein